MSDMHRLPGVAVSLVFHMVIAALWWHQSNGAGFSSMPAAAAQETRIDVRLIAAAPLIAEGALPSIAGSTGFEERQSSKPLQERNAIEKTALPPPVFYGPQEVDKDALPYSAPDPDLLTGVVVSGLPIRVRLYIDASGMVVGVEHLQALADDWPALERIERMLRGTSFMPARLAGSDVNSYQDLEFHIGPELNKTATAD
ncbi:hypothetical protein [Collimonas sp.]|uniref:hypothetical protein n=1 Tax=Collimonas sp. TaxID=1963772 RepID=UPI002B968E97|nr:hypothetical protein [Collimonas sp.]HWX01092.1 hypothetical protein [Collimonas sp.]